MKQMEWDENLAGKEWNKMKHDWSRMKQAEWGMKLEWNRMKQEGSRMKQEWSRMKQFFRENETKNENFDRMKQKWSKIRNETKSVSFISGSWTRHPTVTTVNASCRWQLLVRRLPGPVPGPNLRLGIHRPENNHSQIPPRARPTDIRRSHRDGSRPTIGH